MEKLNIEKFDQNVKSFFMLTGYFI